MVTSHFTRIAPSHEPHDTEKIAGVPTEVVTVRPSAEEITRQGLPYFVGISQATTGTSGISMNLVVIPPGGTAKPHLHRGYETAIYVLKGRVETRYGKGLQQSVINQEGDFIFIPPNVPHQPRNLSSTEPALAIIARNDPNERENVVPYDPTTEH
ncbi:MAG: cupin domain-containing protein [Nitrospira sp.]|nr:cupin domain-containing protein [Nitrospira sp.]